MTVRRRKKVTRARSYDGQREEGSGRWGRRRTRASFHPCWTDRQRDRDREKDTLLDSGVATETLAGLFCPPPGLGLTTPSPSPSRPPPPLPTPPPFLPSFLRLLLFLPSLCSPVSFLSLAPPSSSLHIFLSSSVPSFASPPLAIFRPGATAGCSSLTIALPGRLLRFLVLFCRFLAAFSWTS